MANDEVSISVARPREPMDYWYRFAHGDEVVFIHEGTGVLESQFGTLAYRPGDYLVLPTGVIWRLLPDPGVEQRMLAVEANGHIEPPQAVIQRLAQYRTNNNAYLNGWNKITSGLAGGTIVLDPPGKLP